MLPYFFADNVGNDKTFVMDEAASRHCIQVLRIQSGETILLTDGKGKKITARITKPDRKHCEVLIENIVSIKKTSPAFFLGISFTKNNNRNEWLLEKVAELGCSEIYPVITQRSEKGKLKYDRLNSILISAMLQSQQCFMPKLHAAITLKDLLHDTLNNYPDAKKFMAHCDQGEKKNFLENLQKGKDCFVLIGPEGDFTKDEVALSVENNFLPISLGHNRLRTETAGMYACTVFNALNHA